MKTTRNQLILFVTICLIGAVAWKSYGNNEPPQAATQLWEYKGFLHGNLPNQEAEKVRKVNELGNNGWELVAE